jgi:xylulokinase
VLVAAGAGDNAAAALGLGIGNGDVVISLGTSGTAFARTPQLVTDPFVNGFADATGQFLPLVCTLNAARVLDAAATMLGVSKEEFSRLALSAPRGADGLVMVPYLEGERTPNKPDATGALHGLTLANSTPAHLARATVEGLLCGLADGLDALRAEGTDVRRALLIGGGARSVAVQRLAAEVLGVPIVVPSPGEYVATGAARQAAWALAGPDDRPEWLVPAADEFETDPAPGIRERYAEVRELVAGRVGAQ